MIFVLVTVLLNIKYLDLKSYRSMGLGSITLGKVMAAGRESRLAGAENWLVTFSSAHRKQRGRKKTESGER